MKRVLTGICILTLITGCAVVTYSGVESMGNGIYKISTRMKGIKVNGQENSGITSREAISSAKEYCANKGSRSLKVLDQSVEIGGKATAFVYFRCIK
jgi:uncharacterized protein YxeA